MTRKHDTTPHIFWPWRSPLAADGVMMMMFMTTRGGSINNSTSITVPVCDCVRGGEKTLANVCVYNTKNKFKKSRPCDDISAHFDG